MTSLEEFEVSRSVSRDCLCLVSLFTPLQSVSLRRTPKTLLRASPGLWHRRRLPALPLFILNYEVLSFKNCVVEVCL